MTRAVLSLGSNLGDSAALLREAVASLGEAVVRVSSVYRTPPWGPVAQDDFLNITLLAGDPGLDARGWLDRCHGLERAARRERLVRWGPRTLDADVIGVWGDVDDGVPVGGGPDGDDGLSALSALSVSADHGAGAFDDGRAADPGPAGRPAADLGIADAGAPGAGLAVGPCPAWEERDAVRSDDPILTLPHPRAFERAFVLLPWAEIQPDAVLPGHGPIRDLLARLDVTDIDLVGPLVPPAAPDGSGSREPGHAGDPGRPASRGASSMSVLQSAPSTARLGRAEPR